MNPVQVVSDGTRPDSQGQGPAPSFPRETMKVAQEKDKVLSTVRGWLVSGEKPNSASRLSSDLYTYYNSLDRLSLQDGVICRSWEKVTIEQPTLLVCVPESLQEQVIKASHNIPASGHLAVVKTLSRIRSRFYFPRMDLKVKLHIAACHVCLKKRCNVPKLKAPLTPYTGKHPGHIVQIDLMENLPISRGYHAILVIVDTFSKMAEAIPLRSTNVEVVAKAFVNTWVCRQGVPTQVHSDRGGNLDTAHFIQAVYRILGIEKTRNTAHRPQTDGGVERLNKTVKNMLWKFCQRKPKFWVECLDQVMFAYRTSVSSSTSFSPYFLDKGRLPRLPVDVLMDTAPQTVMAEHYSEAALKLYNRLQEAYSFVEECLGTKQLYAKKRYDRSVAVKEFEIGSWVYVWKPVPHGCTYKKFYDHYRGPFKIVDKVTKHTYKIALDEGDGRFDVIHMEHMKDAQIPPGSAPDIQVKHYAEDLQHEQLSQGEVLVDEWSDIEDEAVEQPLVRERPRRQQSSLIPVPSAVRVGPTLRRSNRIRTPTIPYQHRP